MTLDVLPEKYLQYNTQQTKKISVVVEIEGLDDLLTSAPVFERIKYGDPDLDYGDPDIVYGGLRRISGIRDILSIEGSSLVLSQRLEPEQGRGSVSTLALEFIDKDQFMTQLISPGILLDDILGKRIKVSLGFQDISFPEDFFVVFRGKITQVEYQSGRVVFQLSDPNVGRRQRIFFSGKTQLSAGITNASTTIPVISNSDFHKQILGPNGAYDSAIKTYLKIEDEFIEYPATGFGSNQFTSVSRGTRTTTAVSHAIDSDVESWIEIEDGAIEMALKLMLSGWNGYWKTGVEIESLGFITDPGLPTPLESIVLPIGVDAIRDYGLAEGEYITVSGATNGANNKTVQVTSFSDLYGSPNRIIYIDDTFIAEFNSPALLAFRSQYDTYPVSCGVKLTPDDVDIKEHISLRNTYLSQGADFYRFFIGEQDTCKSFIESQLFLPSSAYSITRQGRISVGYTKPPLADQRFQIIDSSNILEPQNIKPMRGVNNRKFFNEVHYTFNFNDAGEPKSIIKTFDSESLSIIGISSVLPISAKGAKSDLGFESVVDKRTRFILNRYKRGAVLFDVKVNWEIGSQIEAGDVICIDDTDGILQIPNFATGERGFGIQLLEVIDRSFDIKEGQIQLKLIVGVQSELDDRFGTISPSSLVDVGSTTTKVRIKESFGEIFPGNEQRKWIDYFGLPIIVHSYDWTFEEVVTLTGLDPSDDHALMVSPALSIPPPSNYIVDIARYSTSTDPSVDRLYKLIHSHLTPTVDILSGTSNFIFTVASGEGVKFHVGLPVVVHNTSFSILSPEAEVTDVTGDVITVDTDLTFTPASGQKVDLIGFADSGQPYRYI